MTGNEYSQRLQEQYSKIIGNSEIFGWASVEKARADGKDGLKHVRNQVDEDDEDPIARLLKSNTNIYLQRDVILKPEKLDFTKLMNANTGHQHQ